MAKIYFSYSHRDSKIVHPISEYLQNMGNEILIDEMLLYPGVKWRDTLEKALIDSDVILYFVSGNSLASNNEFFKYEIEEAKKYASKQEKLLIPILIDDSPIPSDISDILFVFGQNKLPNEIASIIDDSVHKFMYPVRNRILKKNIDESIFDLMEVRISDVGIISDMIISPARRINIITGDNSIGKSFILDILWWLSTLCWPSDINSNISFGRRILPDKNQKGVISGKFSGQNQDVFITSYFDKKEQIWIRNDDRIISSGIVIYAQPDGGYSLWDPARNGYSDSESEAYIFDSSQILEGLNYQNRIICNGLIRDWASWQTKERFEYALLKSVIDIISPNENEKFSVGELTRIDVNDVRDMPTLKIGSNVIPIIFMSSGVRRIISLIYLLLWSWIEHVKASDLRGVKKVNKITLLIDELDSHLHPKWQKNIMRALELAIDLISPGINIQIIATTHSPLIMASLEPYFDPEQDAWFDLDLVDGEVKIEKRPWYRRGDADAWLKSEAFDQKSGYAPETEQAIDEASAAMNADDFNQEKAQEIDFKLRRLLAENDPFLRRWEYIAQKKGWLK